MIRRILAVLFKFVLSLVFFIVHIGIANLLPQPWNHLDILILISIWLLIFRDQFNFLGYIFVLSVLSELFHSAPFGLNTASLILTVAILDWFLLNVLTNRFFLIVFVAGALGAALYRIIALILLFIFDIIAGGSIYIGQSFYVDLLWEITINGAALTIAYLIPAVYFKRFNPSYLSEREYGHKPTI